MTALLSRELPFLLSVLLDQPSEWDDPPFPKRRICLVRALVPAISLSLTGSALPCQQSADHGFQSQHIDRFGQVLAEAGLAAAAHVLLHAVAAERDAG